MTEPVAKRRQSLLPSFQSGPVGRPGPPDHPDDAGHGGIRQREARASLPQTLGRIGTLEVRLAANAAEVRRAQKLRWRVFYEEMQAIADGASRLARRDIDAFDAICDHLVVIDHAVTERPPFGAPRPAIVGTYRLLRQEVADCHGGFYTSGEFDLSGLLARHRG